jgi:hypothetical protein
MMHTSRHHALDRAQHLYRLPQVRVGALALGGFLEGSQSSPQQSLKGGTHVHGRTNHDVNAFV